MTEYCNCADPSECCDKLRETLVALEQAQADIEVKTIQIRCLGEEWDSAKERIEQLETALRKAVIMAKMSDGNWDEGTDGLELQAMESLLAGDSEPQKAFHCDVTVNGKKIREHQYHEGLCIHCGEAETVEDTCKT